MFCELSDFTVDNCNRAFLLLQWKLTSFFCNVFNIKCAWGIEQVFLLMAFFYKVTVIVVVEAILLEMLLYDMCVYEELQMGCE